MGVRSGFSKRTADFYPSRIGSNEIANWLGDSKDQIEIVATGNLPYNMAALVASGAGSFINLNLNCKYDGVKICAALSAAHIRYSAGVEKGAALFSCHRGFYQTHRTMPAKHCLKF